MTKFEVKISVKDGRKTRGDYRLDDDLSGEWTLADLLQSTKDALINISMDVLKEEQGRGFDKEPVMLVDGRQGKPLTAVNPLGQVEFSARQDFTDIIKETYIGLYKRSPVKTGRYVDSHYVFHNGVQVANDYSRLERWLSSNPEFKEGDTVRIVNVQPYARRLELLGVTAQRTQMRREDAGRRSKKRTGTMVKMPNGAYQLTSRSIRAKYKNNLNIRFTFLPGSSMGLTGVFKTGRKKNSAGRPYLYPTIVFTINTRGLK